MSDLLSPRLRQQVVKHLASQNVLRAAINLSNVLLVTGKDPGTNDPTGVAPTFAKQIADALGVNLKLVPFAHPNLVCDAALDDLWDICLIGADPLRSEHIKFTQPYCEIRATLMVRDVAVKCLADVDRPDKKVVVKGGGAYDLWLQGNMKHPEILSRTETLDESFEKFCMDTSIDALAGFSSPSFLPTP